jgi:hypothetical protein
MSESLTAALPWLSLALLGAFHGVNPGMGWLFAVALGLQERSRAAVLGALGPIAFGHAVSVAVVAVAVALLHHWSDPSLLKSLVAGMLIAFGAYRLFGPAAHPRWVGMRVTGRELAVWSFLMATAHGAGLMLVPVLLRLSGDAPTAVAHAAHAAHGGAGQYGHAEYSGALESLRIGVDSVGVTGELAAVVVHTAAMLLVMALLALVVYEKLGLAILRRGWVNVDRIWAGGLLTAGALTLLL